MQISGWQLFEGGLWASSSALSVTTFLNQKKQVSEKDSNSVISQAIEMITDLANLVYWVANSFFSKVQKLFEQIGFSKFLAFLDGARSYTILDEAIVHEINCLDFNFDEELEFEKSQRVCQIKKALRVGQFFSKFLLASFFTLSCVGALVPGVISLGLIGCVFAGYVGFKAVEMAYVDEARFSRHSVEPTCVKNPLRKQAHFMKV